MITPAQVLSSKVSRRKFLSGMAAGAGTTAALALAGCSSNNSGSGTTTPTGSTITDADILNFALNLEYLEAEYYQVAAYGTRIPASDGGGATITGGSQVSFATPAIQAYAYEIANDELLHVQYLRAALGSAAVAEPDIDLLNSFNGLAMLAGIGSSFNPFDNETDFILGAFVFEDVGVTAYHGAAPLLTNSADLIAAGGILGTEAYHAGLIRSLIVEGGSQAIATAVAIQTVRAAAGGGNETPLSASTIANANPSTRLSYSRTTDQVLHIVYANAAAGQISKGGFFPNGMNGTITTTSN